MRSNAGLINCKRGARNHDVAVQIFLGVFLSALTLLVATTLPSKRASGQERADRPVMLLDVKGAIGVGDVLLVREAISAARERDAELIVMRLDTPGGLVSSTREIVAEIMASRIPIAVYVAPNGARAASAGTYITYASHVAAMAPGTHLGAATPIQIGAPGLPGATPTDREEERNQQTPMERKVTNDAVAYLKSLAELRERNAEWAAEAVRAGATLTAAEAADKNVVDVVASDLGELLNQIDGRTVQTADGDTTLATRNALVVPFESNWRVQFIDTITDPNVAMILLAIGFYGIVFEFWSPGLAGPGIVGGICLIIALMGLSALPISYAGAALLLLGLALMTAEAFAPGFGILGIGGVIASIFGMAFLFDPAGADIEFGIDWQVILAIALTSALFLSGLLGFVVRSHRRAVVTGSEQMIGITGEILSWSGTHGRVRAHGEIWQATAQQALEPGREVIVRGRKGLTLIVEPAQNGESR